MTHDGQLYFTFALVIVTIYANKLPVRSLSASTAIYRAKHCSHISRSGIIFREADRSLARKTMTCPSFWLGNGRVWPFAGGSLYKSMYCPAWICSTSFLEALVILQPLLPFSLLPLWACWYGNIAQLAQYACYCLFTWRCALATECWKSLRQLCIRQLPSLHICGWRGSLKDSVIATSPVGLGVGLRGGG